MFILTSLLPLAQPDLRNESKSIHNPGHTFPNAMMESEQSRMGKKRRKAVFAAIQSMPGVCAGQVGGGPLPFLRCFCWILVKNYLDCGTCQKTQTLQNVTTHPSFYCYGDHLR